MSPRTSKPIQYALLGCAGVGAFYAAAQWSRANQVSAEEVTTPVTAAAPRPALNRAAVLTVPTVQGVPAASAQASGAAAAVPAASAASALSTAAPSAGLAFADRSAVIPGATGDPFAALSWLPPPPPPPPPVAEPPPAPPPPPVAPPLPFTFVGMVEQGTPKPQAFLAKGDALLIVSAGDTIDNSIYRVESLSASQIVLTHVPTNTQQIIHVTGSTP